MDPSMSVPDLPAIEPPLYDGRISPVAFEALIGVFYGLAISTASVRLILQFKIHRRLHLDDYFLIFACANLTAGTILGYVNVGSLYFSQHLNYNPTHIYYLLAKNVDIAAHINTYQRLYYSYPAVLWTAIFAVKFGYLAFFRRLIDRLRPLIIYWRIIVGITVVSFPVCIISIYVACIKWGLEAAKCLEPIYFRHALGLAIFDIFLDVGTDLLLVSIPIRLLWSVKIKTKQKLVLGVFLSLNLFMAVTAAVRVSGLSYRGTFDNVWLFVWQQIEACVAIAMISLTAFRSAFMGSESSLARKAGPKKPWYSSTISALKRKNAQHRSDEELADGLPQIPSATMTGIRTFIQGGHHTGTKHQSQSASYRSTSEAESDEWPIYTRRYETK